MDSNLLRIHEINPFKLYKEELKILEGLPMSISIENEDTIRYKIERQERSKLWMGMAMVWTLFLTMGFFCAGCDSDKSMIWIFIAVPLILYMFLQKSISEEEVMMIVRRRTRDTVMQELKKAQEHLLRNPFMIRRGDAMIENLPQLTHIEPLLDECKRESTMAAQRLLLYKSQLHDLLPEDAIVEEHMHKPNVRRLALRVRIFRELMNSFEKTFALFMNERNRLLVEREKIRMQATMDFHNENIPSPFLQPFPHAPLQVIDKEQQEFFEEVLQDNLKEYQTIDIRWRQTIEGYHGEEEQEEEATAATAKEAMAPGMPAHRAASG